MTAMAQQWMEQDVAVQAFFSLNYIPESFNHETATDDDPTTLILFAMANGLFEDQERLWATVAQEIQTSRQA